MTEIYDENYLIALLLIFCISIVIVVWLRFQAGQNLARQTLLCGQAAQNTDWIIYYASQRGRAKKLALQTALSLERGGFTVTVNLLGSIKPNDLERQTKCLFITSTFGNGQSPEHARGFERKLNKFHPNLSHLNFALLALGDQQYDRFCGFGNKLNQWLVDCQASPINSLITVSQMDKVSIKKWHKFIQEMGGDICAFDNEKI